MSCAEQIDSGLFRYIEKVRDRRFVIDTERGLVSAIDIMDVPGTVLSDVGSANLRVPQSMLSVHLLKIRNGKIVRLETFSRGAPYGLLSGW